MDEPTGDAAAIDALLPALRLREHEAFHDLYDLMAGQLIGYAHARLADRHTAEDVVQDVFVRLTRHARRFRGDGKALLAWLYRTTSRRCTDVHRRRARRKETTVARPQMFLAHRPAYTQAVWAIDDPALEAALDELTPDQREALLLRRVAGLDGDEVAAIMKKSRDAVYALCARAESRLRDRLEQPALPKAEAMPRPGVTVSVIPPGARKGRGAGAPSDPDEGEVLEGDVVRGADPPPWEQHLLPDEADIEDAVTVVADPMDGPAPEPASDADAAVAAWEAARERAAREEADAVAGERTVATGAGAVPPLQAEAAARAWQAAQALDAEASAEDYDVPDLLASTADGTAADEASADGEAADAEGQATLPGLDEEDPASAAERRREEARQRVQRLREAQARLRAEVAEASGLSEGVEASDEDTGDGDLGDEDEDRGDDADLGDEAEDTPVAGADGSVPARDRKKRPRDGRTLQQPSSDLDALRRLSDGAGPGDE